MERRDEVAVVQGSADARDDCVLARYRATVVALAQPEQRDRMPVAHFRMVADQPLSRSEFALRRLEIAALSRFVAKPHMNVRAADGDQAANLDQRLGRVVDAKI